jgi:hypothetical protein
MGLSDWQDMARQVVEDPVLQGLSDDQVRAIIDVFALIIQADRQVNPAEVVGFNYLFYDLDWMSQRHEVIKGRIGEVTKKVARLLTQPGPPKAFLDELAARLTGMELRRHVFTLAVGLSAVDSRIAPEESEALQWVADVFGLDEAKRASIMQKCCQ